MRVRTLKNDKKALYDNYIFYKTFSIVCYNSIFFYKNPLICTNLVKNTSFLGVA